MSTTQRFDSMDPGEELVLTYDFTLGLAPGETLTGLAIATQRVTYGTDSPSSLMLGTPSFDATNKIVFVPVSGGLDQTDYDIIVTVNTTNVQKRFVMGCILPVRVQ